MKDLMMRSLDLANLRGASYADIRIVHNISERVVVKNGVATGINLDESMGFGVRVLDNGSWGFAASRLLQEDEIDRVTDQALAIAKASSLVASGRPTELGPPVSSQGTYVTPIEIDPLKVPLEEKIDVLMAADQNMARVEAVTVREGNLVAIKEHKLFANSDGAYTDQTIYEIGGGIKATAVLDDEVQVRSYPNSHGRQQVTAGWEMASIWDLPGNAERVATEAVQLSTADQCPREINTTVILGSAQLALQIHESCGHPIELDRVFGTEAAFAGTSFLTTDKMDSLQYGSEVVNLTADAIRPLGLGTFGWDDEGVPAQSTPIVRDGLFVGYLMSRETGPLISRVSNGCMRASGWNRLPLIRMTNVSIEPGN